MGKAMRVMGVCFCMVFVALLVYAIMAWQVYRYKDCRRVGHTTMYCILTIGK